MLHEAYGASRNGPSFRLAISRGPKQAAVPLLAFVLIAILGGYLAMRGPEQATAPSDAPGTEAAWYPVSDADALFALDTTMYPEDALSREDRAHKGGGRIEVLRFGRPGDQLGFARVSAYRTGTEARPAGTFYLDLARQAGEEGFAVVRSAVPAAVPSKFGLIETSDVALQGGGRTASCTAWRMVAADAPLRVFGWLCAGEDRVVDPLALSCFVDRLGLVGADPALADLFATADASRDPQCLPPQPETRPHAARWLNPEESAEPQPLVPPAPLVGKPVAEKPAHRRVESTASVGRKPRRPPLY
jgi:hypothetical protein